MWYGERRNTFKILVGISGVKHPLGDIGIGGRIILKFVLEQYGVKDCIGLN
jgi:hypothetical protein